MPLMLMKPALTPTGRKASAKICEAPGDCSRSSSSSSSSSGGGGGSYDKDSRGGRDTPGSRGGGETVAAEKGVGDTDEDDWALVNLSHSSSFSDRHVSSSSSPAGAARDATAQAAPARPPPCAPVFVRMRSHSLDSGAPLLPPPFQTIFAAPEVAGGVAKGSSSGRGSAGNAATSTEGAAMAMTMTLDTDTAGAEKGMLQNTSYHSRKYDGNSVVRVRAQVMMRDDSTGGWVPLGAGGLSHVSVRKRRIHHKDDDQLCKHEYLIHGKRIVDQTVVLSCTIKRDFEYNRVMPTFHHWKTGNKKFGLTFQTAADARAFDKGVRMAVEDLLDGLAEISSQYNMEVGEDDVFMQLDLPVDRSGGGGVSDSEHPAAASASSHDDPADTAGSFDMAETAGSSGNYSSTDPAVAAAAVAVSSIHGHGHAFPSLAVTTATTTATTTTPSSTPTSYRTAKVNVSHAHSHAHAHLLNWSSAAQQQQLAHERRPFSLKQQKQQQHDNIELDKDYSYVKFPPRPPAAHEYSYPKLLLDDLGSAGGNGGNGGGQANVSHHQHQHHLHRASPPKRSESIASLKKGLSLFGSNLHQKKSGSGMNSDGSCAAEYSSIDEKCWLAGGSASGPAARGPDCAVPLLASPTSSCSGKKSASLSSSSSKQRQFVGGQALPPHWPYPSQPVPPPPGGPRPPLRLDLTTCVHCRESFSPTDNPHGSCQVSPDCVRQGLEAVTCMQCAKCLLYHCMADSEGDYVHPCECSNVDGHWARRWIGLTLLSVLVPCLCCYIPLIACYKCGRLCKICGGRHQDS